MRNLALVVVILTLLLVPSFALASTFIVTYGTITDIAPIYGPSGYIQAFHVTMDNLDTTGTFTYICRRPNLGPCVNALVGHDYVFTADMQNFCSVPQKICGEGLIESLTFQQ